MSIGICTRFERPVSSGAWEAIHGDFPFPYYDAYAALTGTRALHPAWAKLEIPSDISATTRADYQFAEETIFPPGHINLAVLIRHLTGDPDMSAEAIRDYQRTVLRIDPDFADPTTSRMVFWFM